MLKLKQCFGTRIRIRRPFTRDSITAEQAFDNESTFFGTSKGQLYLMFHYTKNVRKICCIGSPILTIIAHQRECFFGTAEGLIYIVPQSMIQFSLKNFIFKKQQSPIVIGRMRDAVQKMFILGDGISKYLYSASKNNVLNGYSLNILRNSFSGQINSQISQQLQMLQQAPQNVQYEQNEDQLIEVTQVYSQSEVSECESSNKQYNSLVQPTFSIQVKESQPMFLYGCNGIIAFCQRNGDVKFYTQLNSQAIQTYRYGASFPTCCHLYEKHYQGQLQKFCIIGYQNNEIVNYNFTQSHGKKIWFYATTQCEQSKQLQRIQKVKKQINKYKAQTDEAIPDDHISLKCNININNILKVIEDESVLSINNNENKIESCVISDQEVHFKEGIRAVWIYDEQYMCVADEESVYLFIKKYINQKEESYLLIESKQFKAKANRVEFTQFNDELFLHNCYDNGNILIGLMRDMKWTLYWVE